jgi:hypothetical protein
MVRNDTLLRDRHLPDKLKLPHYGKGANPMESIYQREFVIDDLVTDCFGKLKSACVLYFVRFLVHLSCIVPPHAKYLQ